MKLCVFLSPQFLMARNIPFVFMTGYNECSSIPPEFRAAPLVCKPFEEDEPAHRPRLV